MATHKPAIRFQNISKRFGENQVLDHVSFDVEEKEILFIIGKSGTGKSVTLKHIIGKLIPDSGNIYVDNFHVNQLDSDGLKKLRSHCGMVFQFPALFDFLSVGENIAFGCKGDSERAAECMKLVNLPNTLSSRPPVTLSYGMQKRASIARAIAPRPRVLLFDEPTTGLDPMNTRAIHHLIKSLSHQLGVTCVVVSHDMESALKTADRILMLDQGKVLAHDDPAGIRRSQVQLVKDFLTEVSNP